MHTSLSLDFTHTDITCISLCLVTHHLAPTFTLVWLTLLLLYVPIMQRSSAHQTRSCKPAILQMYNKCFIYLLWLKARFAIFSIVSLFHHQSIPVHLTLPPYQPPMTHSCKLESIIDKIIICYLAYNTKFHFKFHFKSTSLQTTLAITR